jgi:hypothetical protein
VDATIAAAWIGAGVGGGVALVGVAASIVSSVVNSNNTRKATERTVEAGTANTRATLAAAREDRLWDKRCAAYEETLTGMLYRQAKRHHDLRGFRYDDATEQRLNDVFDDYDPPGLFEAQGRLAAYASEAVKGAFDIASSAHSEVRASYAHRAALRESAALAQESGRLEGVPNADTMMNAHRQLNSAQEAANVADDALIKVIRDELRSRPEAAMPLPALPAVRPGFWHRRKGRRSGGADQDCRARRSPGL